MIEQLTAQQRKIAYLIGIVVLMLPIIGLGMPGSDDETAYSGKLARLRQEYDLGESTLGAVDPTSATIHHAYGESLGTRGRLDESIAEIRRASALDPLSGRIAVGLGFMLTNAKRFDEAIAALTHGIELDPDQTLARLDLARAYRLAGMADLAIAESQRMLASGDPLGPAFLAASYGRAGRKADALVIVKGMIDKAQQSHQGGLLIALVFAALGDRDQAFHWLEQAYTEHDTFLPWLKVDPEFDIMRADPRFEELVHRIGIPAR